MHWQEELILGGRVKNSQDTLLRCVFMTLCKRVTTVQLKEISHGVFEGRSGPLRTVFLNLGPQGPPSLRTTVLRRCRRANQSAREPR